MARTPLFHRLPKATQRMDAAQGDVLARYLGVMDSGLDRAHDTAKALLDLRDPDLIPDRYLPLMGSLVGHEWRSDRDRAWNRRRIRDAIRRYSYKGTLEAVQDLVREYGGGGCTIVDQASKLLVLGKQGSLGQDDCYLVAADYWHDGAFILDVQNPLPASGFMEALRGLIPTGERWYFRTTDTDGVVSEAVTGLQNSSQWATSNLTEGLLGFGVLGVDLFLSYDGTWPIQMTQTYPDEAGVGFLLTTGSLLPISADLLVSSGSMGNPLTAAQACLQPEVQVT